MMFQRPKRAFSISTKKEVLMKAARLCFNALNGLFPFLRDAITKAIYDLEIVFQRPKRAFSISTDYDEGFSRLEASEFQRPKRAFSISTAPSGNPHKHWLSSLIFAGICLNILTIAVFWKFFGTFTLCSYFYMSLLSLFS